MKKLLLLFSLVVIAVIMFQSCKKSTTSSSQQSLIQNRWQVQNINTLEHIQGSEDKITNYVGTSADVFDFRSDGKIYISLQGSPDTSNYAIISNNQFSVDGSTVANISTLTSNSFVFNIKTNTTSTDYDQVTYYLKR